MQPASIIVLSLWLAVLLTRWWSGWRIRSHTHTLSLHCLDAKLMCKPHTQPSITVNLATEASQLLLSKTWALLFHPQYFTHLLLQGHSCRPPTPSSPSPHINIYATHTPRSYPTANKGLMGSSITYYNTRTYSLSRACSSLQTFISIVWGVSLLLWGKMTRDTREPGFTFEDGFWDFVCSFKSALEVLVLLHLRRRKSQDHKHQITVCPQTLQSSVWT